MKGPYQRLKHDLRRLWECPECGKHTRAPGDATFQVCGCQKSVPLTQQRCMQLIDEGIVRDFEPPPRPTYRPSPPNDQSTEKRPKRRRGGDRKSAREPRNTSRDRSGNESAAADIPSPSHEPPASSGQASSSSSSTADASTPTTANVAAKTSAPGRVSEPSAGSLEDAGATMEASKATKAPKADAPTTDAPNTDAPKSDAPASPPTTGKEPGELGDDGTQQSTELKESTESSTESTKGRRRRRRRGKRRGKGEDT